MITLGIPYRVVGGLRFYERAEIRDAIAYMRVLRAAGGRPGVRTDRQPPQPRRRRRSLARHARSAPAPPMSSPYAATELLLQDGALKRPGARRARRVAAQLRPLARDAAEATATSSPSPRMLDESGYTTCGRPTNRRKRRAGWKTSRNWSAPWRISRRCRLPRPRRAGDGERGASATPTGQHDDPAWRQGPGVRHRLPARLGGRACSRASAPWTKAAPKAWRRSGAWPMSASPAPAAAPSSATPPTAASMPTGKQHPEPLHRRTAGGARDPQRLRRHASRPSGWPPPCQFPLLARRPREADIWEAPARPARDEKIPVGARVFHQKFGYGRVVAAHDDRLDIDFETAGDKRVLDRFVERHDA